MKNIRKIFLLTLLVSISLIFGNAALAQDPPPPPGGGHGGGGALPPGGGAPIGEGIFIFSLLAAGYGGTKTWKNRKITPQGE
jgi:hypothetical protein